MQVSAHAQHGLKTLVLTAISLFLSASGADAAQMILNEYNAVGPSNWLNGGNATSDSEGGAAADVTLGRVLGNGGDWFELVVVADHLDLRGYRIDVCDNATCNVQLVFTNSALWSDLRAGTLITVAMDQPEDASYDPGAGDWWIALRAGPAGSGLYVSQTPFTVSNSNFQIVVRDAANAVVFGPAGEGIVAGVGVSSTEVFKLEQPPSALTTPASTGYADGVSSSYGAPNVFGGGLGTQDLNALRQRLPVPDSDGDGIADDGDFSGVAGDAPCTSGVTSSCDDNCPFTANPTQSDTGSLNALGANGHGDACECGDADDNGRVTPSDATEVRRFLAGITAAVAAPAKCSMASPPGCNVRTVTGIRRATTPLLPGVAQTCAAALPPPDPSAVLYDPNHVLNVVVTMSPSDFDALRFESRDVYGTLGPGCYDGPHPSPFTEFPATVSIDGETFSNVAIKKKGFYGSADQAKPSLKIDTDQYVGGQTIHGVENFTFNNARQDPALVKTCLAYGLFAAAGLPSSRCNFARVTVNGQYLGVYVNVEEIEQPYLARYFPNTSGNVYEGTLSDFRPTFQNTFEKKTNESDPNQADIAAITNALTLPDDQLLAALEPLVDLDHFYTYWALEGIVGHWDGYQSNRNNFWMYFDPGNGGRLRFLPWGVDEVFDGGNPFVSTAAGQAPVVFPRAMLARRLYLHPTSRAAFIARVQQLMNTVWNEASLQSEVNRMEALIEPYSGQLDPYLTPLRTWITQRRSNVTSEIGGGGPAWTTPLDPAACLQIKGNAAASFNVPYGGSGSGTMTLSLNGANVPFLGAQSQIDASALGTLRVSALQTNFTTAQSVLVSLNPALFAPQTLPLGGALVPFAETTVSGTVTNIRLLVNGSITFTQAASTPNAPVVGTLTGDVAEFVPLP
ncbi:MAG TPA: CotH kinase family protein [Myxococcota bacterium]|nr:CotH kinase family protein [Myxococcota bacterium]